MIIPEKKNSIENCGGKNFKMFKSVRQLEVYGCGGDNVISMI